MAFSSAFPIIQGVAYGLESNEFKRLEDSVRAGENSYLAALFQMSHGFKVLDFVDKANEAAGLSLFSWRGKSVIYLTPVLLAVLKNNSIVPEKIRPVLMFFRNHLSTLYQTAAIISSISLLFFGQAFFAVSSLAILGIGVMDRNGWLPFAFRQFLHRYSLPVQIATGLVSGGNFDRIVSLLSVISWIANTNLSRKKALSESFSFQEKLTFESARDFLAGDLYIHLNHKYIHYNPIPAVPDINIGVCVEKFDQINWERHLSTLRRKLKDDPRFIARHGNPDQKTDREIVEITRRSLISFIDSVKERRILEGEPADYEKLYNYLKIITKYLEDQEDEITKTDIIFRLAVEGGEYCGPGKFQVVESIYAQIIGGNTDIPFRDKIAYCLQNERNQWMERLYTDGTQSSALFRTVGRVVDLQDVHNYNFFLNLFGDELGLRKAAADNDETAIFDPLEKWIISLNLKGIVQRKFWEEHSLTRHVQILIDSIGTGTQSISRGDVYNFWRDWIRRQNMSEVDKEWHISELGEGRLFDEDLETDDRKFNPTLVNLMLVDLGILIIS